MIHTVFPCAVFPFCSFNLLVDRLSFLHFLYFTDEIIQINKNEEVHFIFNTEYNYDLMNIKYSELAV